MPAGPEWGRGAVAAFGLVTLGAAVIIWLAAGPLARAMFSRPDRDAAFSLSARHVPALASFIAGLFLLAGAVPRAVSWGAMQYMRQHANASVFGPSATQTLDQQSVGTGAEILASVIAGAVLLALSRRPNFWQVAEAEPDPEPSAEDA